MLSENGGGRDSLIFLLSIAVLACAFSGCEEKKAQAPQPMERPAISVTASLALTKDVPVYLDEIGKCVAREVVSIQPQVSGKIIEIYFTDGAELKKGDKLFTIDPRPYKVQLEQAEAQLQLDKASLEQAEAAVFEQNAKIDEARAGLAQNKSRLELNHLEFERAKNLLESNAVSKQEFDSKKMAVSVGESMVKGSEATVAVTEAQQKQNQAAIAMARAKIGATQSQIDAAKINLEYTVITSPIDGRAGQRLVDLGNVVTANTGSLLVIQRIDPIYADFSIPEGELARVRQHMAGGTLKVQCSIPELAARASGSESNEFREGDLSFLDTAVMDGAGTVKLRATLQNNDRHFWAGQFVKARLILGVQKDAVLVPSTATQVGQTGAFVYVVKSDSTVEMRPVKTGQRQGDLIALLEGVKGGENVVVTGQLMLNPGAKVAIQSDQPDVKEPAKKVAQESPPKETAQKTAKEADPK